MTRLVAALAAIALAAAPLAAAQFQVEPAGGPLTLAEEVAEAFAAWQRAFSDEELEEPAASIGFAGELLGPDTASLTLRYDDGRTEVLLAPGLYASGPVLVHEVGVLLGVPEVGAGVMDPSLAATGDRAVGDAEVEDVATGPTDEDVALLRDLRAYPAADLTRDGVVDFYDLAAFGTAFGSVGVNLRADLDGDGRVDEADLAVLRAAYTPSEPSPTAPVDRNLAPGPTVEPDATADDALEGGDEDAGATGDEPDASDPGDAPADDANDNANQGTDDGELDDAVDDGPGDEAPRDDVDGDPDEGDEPTGDE